MMDLPIALYVMVRVSLSHPHSVPASAFRMLLRCCTRAAVCRVWGPKQNMVSNVTPRSFGVLLSGSVVLLYSTWGWMLACAVCGVKRVTVVLLVETVRLNEVKNVWRV